MNYEKDDDMTQIEELKQQLQLLKKKQKISEYQPQEAKNLGKKQKQSAKKHPEFYENWQKNISPKKHKETSHKSSKIKPMQLPIQSLTNQLDDLIKLKSSNNAVNEESKKQTNSKTIKKNPKKNTKLVENIEKKIKLTSTGEAQRVEKAFVNETEISPMPGSKQLSKINPQSFLQQYLDKSSDDITNMKFQKENNNNNNDLKKIKQLEKLNQMMNDQEKKFQKESQNQEVEINIMRNEIPTQAKSNKNANEEDQPKQIVSWLKVENKPQIITINYILKWKKRKNGARPRQTIHDLEELRTLCPQILITFYAKVFQDFVQNNIAPVTSKLLFDLIQFYQKIQVQQIFKTNRKRKQKIINKKILA